MEAMREAWTDERLDDLNHRVDEGFKEMRAEFRAVLAEMGGMRSELSAQNAQLQRTILQLAGGMFATMVLGFLAILIKL